MLPVIGVEVFDKDDLVNKADDFDDTYDEFQSAYDAFSANQSAENKQRLIDANGKATSELQQLQGATGYARAGAGASVALPFDLVSTAGLTHQCLYFEQPHTFEQILFIQTAEPALVGHAQIT